MGVGKFFLYAYTKPFKDLKNSGQILKGVLSDAADASQIPESERPENYEAAVKNRASLVRKQIPGMMKKIKSRMTLILAVMIISGLWGLIHAVMFAMDLKIYLSSAATSMPLDTLVTVAVCFAIVVGANKWLHAERLEYQETSVQLKKKDEELLRWVGDMRAAYKSFLLFKRVLLGGVLVLACFAMASLINAQIQQLVIAISVAFFLFCLNIKYSLYLYQIRNNNLCSMGTYLQNAGPFDLLNPEL